MVQYEPGARRDHSAFFCKFAGRSLPTRSRRAQTHTAMGRSSAAHPHTKLGTVLLLAATVLATEPPPPPPTVLEVNGAATKLDALGPVVVG